ncbi:MAG: amidase, partial [Nannocystaceae bacterium]
MREPTDCVAEILKTGQGVIAQLHTKYLEGQSDPMSVAERVLAAITTSVPGQAPTGAMVEWKAEVLRADAQAAKARFAAGKPLSLLDGIPVAYKDEVDVAGFRTRVGTTFIGREAVDADATSVGCMRAAGAMTLGKAAMHEIGCGVTGINLHTGTPVHPHRAGHMPGGSSSGSAVAVASGLCPVALGADGGGSIRIPAALCGVVGLKPTYGRVSEHGAYPLCWSVGHLGPLAASVADCAIAYALMAGPDPAYPHGVDQPAVHLDGVAAALAGGGLEGTRIGVFRPW